MSDHRESTKPTLEELLQLKRGERPDAQFWAGFERELRQKQLTALVEKPRWWHALGGLRRRVYLPAGAAAMVAFALVGIRYNVPVRVSSPESSTQLETAAASIETLPATVVASRFEEPIAPAPPTVAPVAVAPQGATVGAREEISPSARSIAANLARLEQAEPELLHAVMGSRLSSSTRAQAVDEAVLESVPAPTPARYRLIARYADRALSPEPSAPALVRERIARRLGDGLVDDVSRIGLGANRVSLKF